MAKKDEKAGTAMAEIVKPITERPDYLPAVGGAARGNENVTTKDIVIPRLEIVQALSKTLVKSHQNFIEGATAGQLYNSLTRKLYGVQAIFVPVVFEKEWLIWVNRKQVKPGASVGSGNGFRGVFKTEADALRAKKDMENPDTLEVNETHQHYGFLVQGDGNVEEICISMAKTKIKPSKNLNSLIHMNGGDRFSRMYRVGVVEAQNTAGDQYLNFEIANFGFVPQRVFKRAEKLYDLAMQGHVTVDRTTDDDGDEPGNQTLQKKGEY